MHCRLEHENINMNTDRNTSDFINTWNVAWREIFNMELVLCWKYAIWRRHETNRKTVFTKLHRPTKQMNANGNVYSTGVHIFFLHAFVTILVTSLTLTSVCCRYKTDQTTDTGTTTHRVKQLFSFSSLNTDHIDHFQMKIVDPNGVYTLCYIDILPGCAVFEKTGKVWFEFHVNLELYWNPLSRELIYPENFSTVL